MAILARALLREFPDQEYLFHIGAIQFGRRVMRNHNGLIGRYPGADGMKTGFICAGGFNVVASATRDGRRLITVVLGSTSANERTVKAAELFDRGFGTRGFFGPTLDGLPASVLQSPPNMRAVICDRRGPMPGEEDGSTPAAAGMDQDGPGPGLFGTNAFAFAASPSPARAVLGPRAPVQPVRVWIGPTPPSEADLAAQAAEEDAADQARQTRKGKRAVAGKATSEGAVKAAAADQKLKIPTGVIEEGKNGRASVTLKPVSGAKPKETGKKPDVKADVKDAKKAGSKTN